MMSKITKRLLSNPELVEGELIMRSPDSTGELHAHRDQFYLKMKKIVVASQNPVKINATRNGFNKMFPKKIFEIQSALLHSGVRSQPMGDAETLSGASNRAKEASKIVPDADFWVGIESGVEEIASELYAFAWVVIKSKYGKFGHAKTAAFCIPPKVAKLVGLGNELGKATDIVFRRTNSKQTGGAVGILTSDTIDRKALMTDAVALALIPFNEVGTTLA